MFHSTGTTVSNCWPNGFIASVPALWPPNLICSTPGSGVGDGPPRIRYVVGSSRKTIMDTPLLETKFYVPKWRRGLVPRPRLSDRLNRGAESKLTLVSAPAGFGKTTLLADWLAALAVDGLTVTWLSLDQSDNHPASFWTYLIAALQTAEPHIGASAISLLQSPQPPPIETILATL